MTSKIPSVSNVLSLPISGEGSTVWGGRWKLEGKRQGKPG